MKYTKPIQHKPCISIINGKRYLRIYDETKQEMVIIKEVKNEDTTVKNR